MTENIWKSACVRPLETTQRRAIRLTDHWTSTTLDSLCQRTSVATLSLLYRYYCNMSFDELKSLIYPQSLICEWSAWFAATRQPLAKSADFIPQYTFVLMTSTKWNSRSRPLSFFPDTYNLQTFKIRVHRHPHLHTFAWPKESFKIIYIDRG